MSYTPPSGDIPVEFKGGYTPPTGDIEVNFYVSAGASYRVTFRPEITAVCKGQLKRTAAKVTARFDVQAICKAGYFRTPARMEFRPEFQAKVYGQSKYQLGKVTARPEFTAVCRGGLYRTPARVEFRPEFKAVVKARYFAIYGKATARPEVTLICKGAYARQGGLVIARPEFKAVCKGGYALQAGLVKARFEVNAVVKARYFTFALRFKPEFYAVVKGTYQPRNYAKITAHFETEIRCRGKKFENPARVEFRPEFKAVCKGGYNKTPVLVRFRYSIAATVKGFYKVQRARAEARFEVKMICKAGVDHPPYFTSIPPRAATHPFIYRYEIEGRDREGQAYISPIILPSWLSYAGGVISGIPPDPLHALPSYYCMMQIVDKQGLFQVQEWGIKVLSVYENPLPNDAILRWLSQPYAGRLVTVLMRGYNLTTHTEDEFYFASGEFRSGKHDSPPHRPFLEYLLDIPVFESSVSVDFQGADATWGSLTLFNQNLEYLINNYAFDYRSIIIKIGEPTWAYNDFYTLFSGTIGAAGLSVDNNTIHIPLRNNAALLNKKLLDASVSTNIYPKFLADGVSPHPAAEQLIPEVWGGTHYNPVFNVKATLIEPGEMEYQVHNGKIGEIVEVTDMGDPVEFTANLENGTFKLLQGGAKDVRCKVVGGKILQDNAWVQPNTAADLVKMLALRAGIDPSMILQSAFDQLNGSDPSVIGFVVTDETKIIDLVKPILNSVNSIHEFNPDGKLIVRKLVAPKAAYEKDGVYNPLYTITSDDVGIHGVQIEEILPPLKSYTIRYNHNNSVLNQVDDRIAEELPVLQALLKKEWSEKVIVNTTNANIGAYLSAQPSDKINSFLIREGDAAFYGDVCMAYRAFPRLRVKCEVVSDKGAAFRNADHIAFKLELNEYNVNSKRFVISKVSHEPLARKTTIQAVEIQSE